ncbi:MAG: MerR family transcriptional regulator [Planctomycetota bacterium]
MRLTFPITDLRRLVDEALASGSYSPPDSARIRSTPDTRTIRYYTTLGLIDRPAEMQGRTALYGSRHVMQLVAIKRLQAEGLTLAEIQARLTCITPAKLKKISDIPASFWKRTGEILDSTTDSSETDCQEAVQFWLQPAAQAESASLRVTAQEAQAVQATACIRISIAPGVEVIVDQGVVGKSINVEAIQQAAEPLLEALTIEQN